MNSREQLWAGRARRLLGALGIVAASMGCTPLAEELIVTTDGEEVNGAVNGLQVSRDGSVIAFSTGRENNVDPCPTCVRNFPIHILDRSVGRLAPRCRDLELSSDGPWTMSEDGRYVFLQEPYDPRMTVLRRIDWRACVTDQIEIPWATTFVVLPDGEAVAWTHSYAVGLRGFDGRVIRHNISDGSNPAMSIVTSRDGRYVLVGGRNLSGDRTRLVDLETNTSAELGTDYFSVLVGDTDVHGIFSDDGASLWTIRSAETGLYFFERTRVADHQRIAVTVDPFVPGIATRPLDDERVVISCDTDFGPNTMPGLCVLRPDGALGPIRGVHPTERRRIYLPAVAAASHELVYLVRQESFGYRIYIITLDG